MRSNHEDHHDDLLVYSIDKYTSMCIRFRNRLDELGASKQKDYIVEEFSEFIKEECKIARNKGDQKLADEECMDLINSCFVYLFNRGYNMATIISHNKDKIDRNMSRLIYDQSDI